MSVINTFVFFDIETTSLPHLERNQTKIIELSLVAALRTSIEATPFGEAPPVTKLTFCLNPDRPVARIVSQMTGISRKSLQKCETFVQKLPSVVSFLQDLPTPVCLVAHNGNVFDYKILLAELNDINAILPQGILCVDSLPAFRNILLGKNINYQSLQPQMCTSLSEMLTEDEEEEWPDLDISAEDWEEIDCMVEGSENGKPIKKKGQKTKVVKEKSGTRKVLKEKTNNTNSVNFKLVTLYKRLLNREDINAHRAEGDCLMLLFCVVAVKHEFLAWSDKNCQLLTNIQPLRRY